MARKEAVKIKLRRRKKELANEKMKDNPYQDRAVLGMLATAGIGAGVGALGNIAGQYIGRGKRNDAIDEYNQEQDSNKSYNEDIANKMAESARRGLVGQNYSKAFLDVNEHLDNESGFNGSSFINSTLGGAGVGAMFGGQSEQNNTQLEQDNTQSVGVMQSNANTNSIPSSYQNFSNLGIGLYGQQSNNNQSPYRPNNNQSFGAMQGDINTNSTPSSYESSIGLYGQQPNNNQFQYLPNNNQSFGAQGYGGNPSYNQPPYNFAEGTTDMNAQSQAQPNQLIDIKGGNGQTDSIDAGKAFINNGETMMYPTIYSDSFKIDVELAAQNNLPSWSVGKTPAQISKVINRKYQGSDKSAKNTKERLFSSLDGASEMFRAQKQQAEQEQAMAQGNPNNPNPGQPMMDGSGQGQMMGQDMLQQAQGQSGLAYGGEIPPGIKRDIARFKRESEYREWNRANRLDPLKPGEELPSNYIPGAIDLYSDVEPMTGDARTYNRLSENTNTKPRRNQGNFEVVPMYDEGTPDITFDPRDPNGDMNGFNQYIPALAGYASQAIGPIYDLTRGTSELKRLNNDNLSPLAQYSPEQVDYGRAVDEANLSALQAKSSFNRVAGNTSSSAGQLMSNVGANTRSINARNTMDKAKILEQEANVNTGAVNQARQFNATQANRRGEVAANLELQYDNANLGIDKYNLQQLDKLPAVNQLGKIGSTVAKDYMKQKALENNIGISGTNEYGQLIAKDGSIVDRRTNGNASEYRYTDGTVVYALGEKEVSRAEYNKYMRGLRQSTRNK